MRKLTTEEFIEKSIEIHGEKYDYTKTIYTNSGEKVIITCKEHGEFTQRASAHLDGQGCMECRLENRRIGLSDFLQRSFDIHGDKFNYSLVDTYINSKTKVKLICKEHGVFEITPEHHINREQGCAECKRLGLKAFIEKSNITHNNKYDYSLITEYKTNKDKVDIICKEHGVFNQRIDEHIHRGTGCPECAQEKVRISTKEFIDRAKKTHGDKYKYSTDIKFKSNKDKVEIICDKHGIFTARVDNHLSGGGYCPSCIKSTSMGEEDIKKYLINNSINFIAQKKFEDCRNINPLPFDFYLPELNTCIEFNGKQHYEPIEYFGGVDSFESLIKRDNIKKEYCGNNNIKLLVIKYDDNIEDMLNLFIGEIKIIDI